MSDPTAAPIRPSEERARAQVATLLAWAGSELGFAPDACRPCHPDLVRSARQAQDVASLPPAHEELLLRCGGGGEGSALVAIFGADKVGVDAMIGGLGAAPMRGRAMSLITAQGYDLDEFDVVIRVRPGRTVDYVVTGSPDPPVWSFTEGGDGPVLRHASFTEWLQFNVLRAVKRRHPLKRVRFPVPSGAS